MYPSMSADARGDGETKPEWLTQLKVGIEKDISINDISQCVNKCLYFFHNIH